MVNSTSVETGCDDRGAPGFGDGARVQRSDRSRGRGFYRDDDIDECERAAFQLHGDPQGVRRGEREGHGSRGRDRDRDAGGAISPVLVPTITPGRDGSIEVQVPDVDAMIDAFRERHGLTDGSLTPEEIAEAETLVHDRFGTRDWVYFLP